MDNYDKALQLSAEAYGSEGAAMEKYGFYQDSIAAKMDRITASWQEFIIKMKESEIVGDILSGIENIMKALASDTGVFVTGTLAPLGTLIGGLAGAKKGFKEMQETVKIAKMEQERYAKVLDDVEKAKKDLKNAQDLYAAAQKAGNLTDKESAALKVAENAATNAQNVAIEENTRRVVANNAAKKATTNAYLLGILAVVSALYLLIKVIDKVVVTDDELRDRLDKSAQDIEGTKDTIDGLNGELKTTEDRIKELQEISEKGGLLPDQKEELELLKEKNAELDVEIAKQKELLGLQEEQAEKDADELARRTVKSSTKTTGSTTTYSGGEIPIYADISRPEKLKENLQLLDEADAKLDMIGKKKDELNDKYRKGAIDESEYQKQNNILTSQENAALNKKNLLTEQNIELVDDLQKIKAYSDQAEDIKEATEALEEYIIKTSSASENFDRIFNDKNTEKAKKSLIDMANAGELSAEKIEQSGNVIVNALADAGFSYDEIVVAVQNYIDKLKEEENAVNKTAIAEKGYATIIGETKDKIDVVNSAKEQLNKTGYLTSEMVQKLGKQFDNLDSYLTATENGFILTNGALEDLLESTIEQYRIEKNDAIKAANSVLDSEFAKKNGFKKTTAAIEDQLVALRALYGTKMRTSFQEVLSFGTETGSLDYKNARREYDMLKEQYNIVNTSINNLKNSATNLKKAEDILKIKETSGTTGGTSKSISSTIKDDPELVYMQNIIEMRKKQAESLKDVEGEEWKYINVLKDEGNAYLYMQDMAQRRIDTLKASGVPEEDERVQEWLKLWWDYEKERQSIAKELKELPKEEYEKQMTYIDNIIDLRDKEAESIEGVEGKEEDYIRILEDKGNALVYAQERVHDEASRLRELGYKEESAEIQELQKLWWDYELQKRSLAKETADYKQKLIDDEIDRSKDAMDELTRVVDNLMKIRKNQLDEEQREYDYLIKKNQAALDAYQGLWEITDKIRDERKSIADELEINKQSFKYMDDKLRDEIFNESDYIQLSKVLDSIGQSAEEVYRNFRAEIEDLTEFDIYKVEEITQEYQRQYNMKLMEYDIAKAEMNVVKKQTELQNVLSNRNVRRFVSGQGWVWSSDYKAVQDAMKGVSDAETERDNAQIKKNQQEVIDWYNRQIDSLTLQSEASQNWYDELERQWERIQSQLEIQETSFSTVLQNILNSDVPTLRRVLESVGGEFNDFISLLGTNKKSAGLPFGNMTGQKQPSGDMYDRQYLENKIAWQRAYERGDRAEMARLGAENKAYRERNNIPEDVITYDDAVRMLEMGLYRNSTGNRTNYSDTTSDSSSVVLPPRYNHSYTPGDTSSGELDSDTQRFFQQNYDKNKDYTTSIREAIARGDYAQAEYDLNMKKAKEEDMKKSGVWDDSWSNVDDLRKEIDDSKKKKYDKGGILDGIGGIKATRHNEVVFDSKLTSKILDPVRSKEFLNVADGLSSLLDNSTGIGSIIKTLASGKISPASSSTTDSHDIYLPEGFMASMTKQDSDTITSIFRRYIPITQGR